MIWKTIKNTLFWGYDRGTWQYDVLVVAILVFIFATPKSWFDDGPRTAAEQGAHVELLTADLAAGTQSYKVDVHLLAPPSQAPEMERQAHEALKKNVDVLKSRTFQVVGLQAVRDEQGIILYYVVTVK